MFILNEIVELSVEEKDLLSLEDDEETPILAAVSTYMRRDLNRSEGFFENILPRYSLDEFKGHFRMTRASLEALCREVQATGRVPQRHSYGRPPIPFEKQVLAFVWFIANSEVMRSVCDRFDVTLSSLNRIILRVSGACVNLRNDYIKWPNSTLQIRLF